MNLKTLLNRYLRKILDLPDLPDLRTLREVLNLHSAGGQTPTPRCKVFSEALCDTIVLHTSTSTARSTAS